MATVVYPRPSPWADFPKAMDEFASGIESFVNSRNEKADAEILAKTPPEKLAEILPQLKSPRMREAALNSILKNQPRDVYQQSGGKLVKTGDKIPGNAEILKPDPNEAIDRRYSWQAQNQADRDERLSQRQTEHDQRMMDRMLAVAGLKLDQKTPNEIELAGRAAKGDKEAIATLETLSKYRADAAGAKAQATGKGKAVDDKAVQFYGDQILAGNPMPMGMGGAMRQAVGRYVQDKMDSLGTTPQDVATRTNVRKALSSSYSNQEKAVGMMEGFVKNINKQVDRVEAIEKDLVSRIGVRGLDVPLRELKTRFAGSGNEKILEAYMLEISNEIGKLSTGSSASIKELSVEAQAKWEKIHDPALSMKDLKTILNETKHMANMRIDSSKEGRDITLNQLKSIGGNLGVKDLKQMGSGETLETEQGTYVKGADGLWHLQE